MSSLHVVALPLEVWEKAAAARSRLLMLDYDGTLAPFRLDRHRAVPSRGVLDLLAGISRSRQTRLAIVSGRPLHELNRFLTDLPIRLIGEHGWEVRLPDGRIIRHPLPAACAEALDLAARAAQERGWRRRLERKRSSLMLHTRGLPSEEARRLEDSCARLWSDEIGGAGLRLHHVDGGIELRSPGRHKGVAVRELMAECPEDTFAVYVGDDETDEDAFQEVRGSGFGILVGQSTRPTLAAGRIRSAGEVASFLDGWLVLVEGAAQQERESCAGKKEE